MWASKMMYLYMIWIGYDSVSVLLSSTIISGSLKKNNCKWCLFMRCL